MLAIFSVSTKLSQNKCFKCFLSLSQSSKNNCFKCNIFLSQLNKKRRDISNATLFYISNATFFLSPLIQTRTNVSNATFSLKPKGRWSNATFSHLGHTTLTNVLNCTICSCIVVDFAWV